MRCGLFLHNCRIVVFSCAAYLASGTFIVAQETIRFLSDDRDLSSGAQVQLDGYIFRPSGEGPLPAVVAMHNCAGLFVRNQNRLAAYILESGQWLARLGYLVLFPD